jgi:hypothetical protein
MQHVSVDRGVAEPCLQGWAFEKFDLKTSGLMQFCLGLRFETQLPHCVFFGSVPDPSGRIRDSQLCSCNRLCSGLFLGSPGAFSTSPLPTLCLAPTLF